MKAFVVLIPVHGSISEGRPACERIEAINFKIGGAVQATTMDVRGKVIRELGVDDSDGVEVYGMSDFMDAFNDEEIKQSDYFMGYVYA